MAPKDFKRVCKRERGRGKRATGLHASELVRNETRVLGGSPLEMSWMVREGVKKVLIVARCVPV